MHRPTCSQVICTSLNLKIRKAVPWRKFKSAAAWGKGWMLYRQTRKLFMIVRLVDSLKCWKRGNNCWEEKKRTKGSCEMWKTAQIKKSDWNRPSEDNGGGVMSGRLQSRRYQHLSSHKNNSWTSIHKRKWPWDGSEIQLRACVNTVEQKWRINEQKGLGGISWAGRWDGKEQKRSRYLYQLHSLCHHGPQWPGLWRTLLAFVAKDLYCPHGSCNFPTAFTAEEPVVIVGMGPVAYSTEHWVLSPWS